ncbi:MULTISPECIES: MFS transporter [unclassified Streptomyces]|uniref:MFS transporter n=1 Tax=unclassified Streptomyces TaxID=2593676 RepID=UPI002259917B|nr:MULTISPECIES: MFS transporter [unclassified Streptomyces]MCX5103872.1 MFS transporter [Streptomyces sp. NBC_00439]WSC31990.1 MFS transporter [Streptomyces sp. NBC_01768]WSX06022.1 MFS transporter [Streptomyces sp. NBC_00987]
MIGKVWPLVIAAVSLGIDAYVLAGVLPDMADSLATTAGAIGLGVTAFTAAYAAAGPFLSRVLVGRSTHTALLVALGTFNLGNLATALAPTLGIFLTSRVVAGAGAGVLTAVATATAGALVADHERGRAMALVTFGLSTGTVAGVPLGMLIGEQVGWRGTMGFVVLIGVLSMLALALRSGTLPQLPASRSTGNSAVPRSPRVALGIALSFVLGLASLGLYTYLLPMADESGLNGWGFALVWAWGIGGVLGSGLIGRPLDALGPRRLMPIVPAFLLASFLIVWLVDNPAAWLIATAVWGASGWISVPVLQQALTRDRTEQAMPIVAFQMAAMYLGSAAGSALGSALLAGGVTADALPGWAALAVAGGMVLAVLVARLTPRSAPNEQGAIAPRTPTAKHTPAESSCP